MVWTRSVRVRRNRSVRPISVRPVDVRSVSVRSVRVWPLRVWPLRVRPVRVRAIGVRSVYVRPMIVRLGVWSIDVRFVVFCERSSLTARWVVSGWVVLRWVVRVGRSYWPVVIIFVCLSLEFGQLGAVIRCVVREDRIQGALRSFRRPLIVASLRFRLDSMSRTASRLSGLWRLLAHNHLLRLHQAELALELRFRAVHHFNRSGGVEQVVLVKKCPKKSADLSESLNFRVDPQS